jgi:hypothetical protein
MSPTGSSAPAPEPLTPPHPVDERQEWIYRGAAGAATLLFVWLLHRGGSLLLLAPLILGSLVTALRVAALTGFVDAIEARFQDGASRAAALDGKFARYFQRPFFATSLAIWRWTAAISDAHLRAGLRVAAFLFICGVAAFMLVTAVYVIVAIVFLMIALVVLLWILSLSDSSSSGSRRRVTRHTSDRRGRPKQEHFNDSGEKVGESRPDSDSLGRPKTVHKDADGNVVGESRPDTDWLGNPKVVHRDTDGNVTGESRPDTDWLGNAKVVHRDADGNVTGESREESDWLGRPKTVRYDK